MDSQDKNKFDIRQREETLARRMGEALDRLNPPAAARRDCPDAEILAAYAEQALAPAESDQWENHFATCARCRNILRVLSASADTPLAEKEVARLGESVSAVRAPIEISKGRAPQAGRSNTRVDWRTRWIAPALGAAAVLAVWFAMRPPWRAMDRDASTTLIAQAPKEEVPPNYAPAETDKLSKVAPQDQPAARLQQKQNLEPAPPPARVSGNAQSFKSPAESPAKRRDEALNEITPNSPGASDAAGSLQMKKSLDRLPESREPQASASATASTAPPAAPLNAQALAPVPAAPQAAAKADLDSRAKQARQDKAKAESARNEPGREKDAASGQTVGRAASGSVAAQQALAAPQSSVRSIQAVMLPHPLPANSTLLKAISGTTLWRAGKSGLIERSTDAGKTWVAQTSPSHEDWLAGAALSDTVCWVAGRNGAIARTTDGGHWELVSPPAGAAGAAGADGKFPDWMSMTATDAMSATVMAADGRKFATADGGKTWQAR